MYYIIVLIILLFIIIIVMYTIPPTYHATIGEEVGHTYLPPD